MFNLDVVFKDVKINVFLITKEDSMRPNGKRKS